MTKRLATLFAMILLTALVLNGAAIKVTTTSLGGGTVGQAYSATLSATGGTTPYTWSISAGNLPSGLTLSGAGTISGSPTTAGTFNFTVKATSFGILPDSDTQALSIVVIPGLAITTSSLPNGQMGVAYSQNLQASGGTTPYTWSISAGSLPQGISLAGAQISGTPASAGTASFTVKVVDKNSLSSTQALSITISPAAISITTASLPGGQAGVAYSQTLQASGGTGTYTWSIASGTLPQGLNLSTSGQIAGTPTASGTSNFTVKVNDSGSGSATHAFSISVTAAPVSITTASLPNGQAGVAYSQTLQASGGTGTYTWSMASGALPTGLSLGASGQIAGTPTIAGTANFTVKANDTGSGSATRALAITIAAAAVPVSITTTSLATGQVGIPYSQTLQATGGTGPYTWSIASGALPGGLSLNSSGQISGTPSSASTASFSVRAADSTNASATAPFSIVIAAALTAGACPATSGPVGQPFSMTLSASGGTPPYTWSIASGQLPPGLSLNATAGQIGGTPSTAGSFSFGVKVLDQNSASASSTCGVTITPAAPALAISTASLPSGLVGTPYSQALLATGGQAPYSWSVSSGALPPGLSLTGGQVSGTPTTSGTFPLTIRVTDSGAKSTTKDFAIQIGAALTLVTTSLSPVKTGVASSQQLSASGGVPPYVWTVVAGTLPSGLTLAASGAISGTATAAGSYGFTVRVTDAAMGVADRAFTLLVTASLAITACPAASATQGQTYSSTSTAAGGQPPYAWTLASGSLPSGILFNSSSGALSGAPGDVGSYSYTLLVTDKANGTATRDCQLVVASTLTIATSALPDASPSGPYSQPLSAVGGKTPYSWTLLSGNLPGGLTLSAGGTISGLATQVGSFSFTVNVTDAAAATAQRALSINVVFGLIISSCPATVGEVGLSFNSQLTAVGGTPPYTWILAAGSLPSGVTLDRVTGAVSGVPTQAGSVEFTLNARDSNLTANKQCSIDVRPALVISSLTLSGGTSGSKYSDVISNTGGVGPFVWSTTAGALPPGLSLSPSSGQITGTPLVVGTFGFTAKAIDAIGGQATRDLSISIAQGLTIQDCPTPVGGMGQNYSSTLIAVGGSAPYSWKIDSGALPSGLVLSSDKATVSGVPLDSGLFTYVLHLDDSNAKSTTRLCSIQISAANLSITSATVLPNGLMGAQYSQTLTATGGRAPYSWSITTTGAPDGFKLSSAGILTGLPSAPGNFSFTVQVTDQDNGVARQSVTLTVLAGKAPGVSITGLPDIVDPAQQPAFALQLDAAYPAAIDGTLTLVFIPDPAIGIDDPAVQFATGGRALKFTVPSASTQVAWSAPVVAFQSGTVAGTIQLNVQLQSNGTDISPDVATLRTVRVDRLAPRIVSVSVVKTPSGFDVHLTGFATTREVTQGTFRFSGDTGGSAVEVAVPLDTTSKIWFQNASSGKFGGQFGLVQSFQWQGQPTSTLNSVSVSLGNAQGASATAQAKF